MHERALVSRTVAQLASLSQGMAVSEVTLAAGPDTPLPVVEDAWRSATAGTSLEAASLVWVVHEHGLRCLDCGVDYRGDRLEVCPDCGGNGLVVEPAPEITLEDWVVREQA